MKKIFATACMFALMLAATPHARAQTGGGFKSPTTGTYDADKPRIVRNRQGPTAVRGVGLKVTRACKRRHCHSH